MAKMLMGRRTGDALFGTKDNTYANKFCRSLLNAGKMGFNMAEAKNAPWNPKKHNFKDTAQRLVIEGLAEYDQNEDRYCVTEKGLEEARKLPRNETSIEEFAEINSTFQETISKPKVRRIGIKWHMHLQQPGYKPIGPRQGNQSVRTACGVMRIVKNTTMDKTKVTCPWCKEGRTFNT